uniref:Uncharacterized protein n=1 Tax=Anopheles atroparvus TaxID=41427 RepID=A0A182INV9_ANOAO
MWLLLLLLLLLLYGLYDRCGHLHWLWLNGLRLVGHRLAVGHFHRYLNLLRRRYSYDRSGTSARCRRLRHHATGGQRYLLWLCLRLLDVDLLMHSGCTGGTTCPKGPLRSTLHLMLLLLIGSLLLLAGRARDRGARLYVHTTKVVDLLLERFLFFRSGRNRAAIVLEGHVSLQATHGTTAAHQNVLVALQAASLVRDLAVHHIVHDRGRLVAFQAAALDRVEEDRLSGGRLLVALQATHAIHVPTAGPRIGRSVAPLETRRANAVGHTRVEIRLIAATVLARERVRAHRLDGAAVLHAHLARPLERVDACRHFRDATIRTGRYASAATASVRVLVAFLKRNTTGLLLLLLLLFGGIHTTSSSGGGRSGRLVDGGIKLMQFGHG